MDGKGHRMLAPVFTACSSMVLMKFGLLQEFDSPLVTTSAISAMSLLSITSARWCDADLLALKPTPIITGTAKKRYSKRYKEELYYVKMSKAQYKKKYGKMKDPKNQSYKEEKKYEITKSGKVLLYYKNCKMENPIMLFWAMLFKLMGLKKHRGWQSHSPLIWIPFWLILTLVSKNVTPLLTSSALIGIFILLGLLIMKDASGIKKLKITGMTVICAVISIPILFITVQYLSPYLYLIVASLGLGYLSHIAGDSLTQEGMPVLADNKLTRLLKKIPIIGKLVVTEFKPVNFKIGKKKFKIGFAKASNKWYPYIVMGFFLLVTLMLLDFSLFLEIFKSVTLAIFKVIWFVLVKLWEFIMYLFSLLKT